MAAALSTTSIHTRQTTKLDWRHKSRGASVDVMKLQIGMADMDCCLGRGGVMYDSVPDDRRGNRAHVAEAFIIHLKIGKQWVP